jgi:heterodisulfide reductase subunit B/heterodisulfide reductase subunit C
MQEFAVFWGCTIPARFPFIEKATRVVLDDLGVRVRELEGHTCCPEGTLVKANAPHTFYTAAARNLALVERAGLDVVTPCNGCYSTFREAQSHLATHRPQKDEINQLLDGEDLRYEGDLRVWHLAEWLADDVGAGLVAARTVRSLGGLRVAVHYGCHLLRPQPAVRWDDPMAPTKVERLVAAMGATVVDYPTKMQCCGGALDRVGERPSALEFARRKLVDLQEHQVDALVVVCPSCFQQFDLNQAALKRAGEDLHVPVLYLAELMALAGGHEPDEIGLGMHRVDVQPFLDAWSARLEYREQLAASFDVSLLDKCDGCRACADDCPVCKVDESFVPNELIGSLLREGYDGVVSDPQVWKCLECYTCQELCPSDIGMAETFRKLKELAKESGAAPDSVTAAYRTFVETGTLGAPKESARAKLGLAPLPASGGDAVARLLGLAVRDEKVAGR